MNMVHPSVHPIEAPPFTDGGAGVPPNRSWMKDVQGMPGTPGGLALRFSQFVFALTSLSIMASTTDFIDASAFRYLVAAVALQSLWSLSLAIVDIYALLVQRCLRNSPLISFFTIGDGITSTLTFAAACASAGITVLLGNDLRACKDNNCRSFQTATAMAFISWFAASPSFILNFWSLASR
ncbi:hypothetical protein IFM89_002599 [Coptis chinensis]|uniref:CASP-like protein n=1 Tax=Coptis chinensis TaxID=261450 RepID=A0A835HB00_9MAGN|nr:hypothetical protein IFM89_002599 [Coptis chinensis]